MKGPFIFCFIGIFALIGCVGSGSTQSKNFNVSDSSNSQVYVKLGVEYMKKQQLGIALKNFERALELDSRNSGAHNMIAVLFDRLDQNELALKHFRKAVSLRPSNASAQNNYGKMLCSLGEYEKAQKHLTKAYTTPLYKNPWVALTNAGRCARKQGDLPKADRYLRLALKKSPEFPPALLELAIVNFDSDNYFLVRAFLQRYESVAGHTPESLWIGIQSENADGNEQRASDYARLLRETFPGSEEAALMQKAFSRY